MLDRGEQGPAAGARHPRTRAARCSVVAWGGWTLPLDSVRAGDAVL